MKNLTITQRNHNICDLYNVYVDFFPDIEIEFGRRKNRKKGNIIYAKGGFVKIRFQDKIHTEIIQTTHLLIEPKKDIYGLLDTAYAQKINK